AVSRGTRGGSAVDRASGAAAEAGAGGVAFSVVNNEVAPTQSSPLRRGRSEISPPPPAGRVGGGDYQAIAARGINAPGGFSLISHCSVNAVMPMTISAAHATL